ncbi:MAG: DUF1080 domain-containing protein [Armatimonadia bacterium]|nr:DUF1080 domain-containing protein [Armatimonadia bacterium]
MHLELPAPDEATILFNGTDMEGWKQRDGSPAVWKVEEGVMTAGGGDIMTEATYQDAYIHVEFKCPDMPEAAGQAKGNSGVYLQGRYEIQVLDSYGVGVPGKGDCGAIYDQFAPLVNACRPPEEWQSFDIVFRTARLDGDGNVVSQARMTVLQNSRVIHNNVEVLGPTGGAVDQDVAQPGSLLLQDHGDTVQYRNIWMIPLPLAGSTKYEPTPE